MATATHLHSTAPLRQEARHPLRVACPVTAREGNVAKGLGGHSIAGIVMEHCGDQPVPLGVIVEYLDAQVGVWQYSLDDGETWRTIRTDLINRPGYTGLALERWARLRVLPSGGGGPRSRTARIVFHATQRAPGDCNGSYQIYPHEDRDDAARSVTLVLTLAAINGMPPDISTPRPRNKRAMAAQRNAA